MEELFFLPGFGISLFSVVVVSEGFDVVVVVDELDEELELDEEDVFDEELELDEEDELDEELELDEEDVLDEELELGVGGVCSFSPSPSPEPVSNLTSRVKLRGSGMGWLLSMSRCYERDHQLLYQELL